MGLRLGLSYDLYFSVMVLVTDFHFAMAHGMAFVLF